MKQIAAAFVATALTLGIASIGAAQTGAPATQHAMHATTTKAHTTAAPRHAIAPHRNRSRVSEARARRTALGSVAHGTVKSHQLTHVTHECGAIDLARPERGEVPGRHLAVDQLKAPSRELARQQHERDL